MTPRGRREVIAGLARLALLAIAAPPLARPGGASDVPAARGRRVGHPRARFPLAVFATPAPDARLEGALTQAVEEWNQVAGESLGVTAFAWHQREDSAQVILRFVPPDASGRLMGETRLEADETGVLRLPVQVTLYPAVARGQTPVERLLFQIAAHELGHALGLPHENQPGSLMCCDRGALDFEDPRVREAYVAARRQPSVSSAAPQLVAHYRAFWGV